MAKTSRTRQSAKNAVVGYIYQIVVAVLGFVSRTVFIRTIGVEYVGLNTVFSDFLNLLSVIELGFGTAVVYTFYRPLAEGDQVRLASLIRFYRKVYLCISAVITVAGLLALPLLRYIINVKEAIPHLHLYYLFALANVVISYLYAYKVTILTADQKNYIATSINMGVNILKTVLQIAVLVLYKNYIGFLAIGVVGTFLNNFLSSKMADRLYPYINRKTAELEKEEKKSIFHTVKALMVCKISNVVYTGTDNIIASILVSTMTVGLYSNYFLLGSKLLLVIQVIFSGLSASVGNAVVKENKEKNYEIFSAMQSLCFIASGVISSVLSLMATDTITVWLGKSYTLSPAVVAMLTFNTYITMCILPMVIYREVGALYVKIKYALLTGAMLNIVLSLILGHIFGLPGILAATGISQVVTSVWYEPIVVFGTLFSRKPDGYYGQLLCNTVLTAAVMALLGFVFRHYRVVGMKSFLFKGIVCGCVSLVVFLAAYAKSRGVRVLVEKIRYLIGAKRAHTHQMDT